MRRGYGASVCWEEEASWPACCSAELCSAQEPLGSKEQSPAPHRPPSLGDRHLSPHCPALSESHPSPPPHAATTGDWVAAEEDGKVALPPFTPLPPGTPGPGPQAH